MGRRSDEVLVEEPSPGVRLITLNLPRVHNAMTKQMTETWRQVLEDIRLDGRVRSVVLTGAGPSFCSGADLSFLEQGGAPQHSPGQLRETMIDFYDTWLKIRQIPVPVIAAVNGPAIGAGLCLALACDLRYGNRDSIFSAQFGSLGMHGGMGVTYLLPEIVGMGRAREMLYTSRMVEGQEALRWGLVNDVVDNVVDHSVEVARQIAEAAPLAMRLTKAGLENACTGFEASLRWEGLAQPVTMATDDLREGIQARREGRPPQFKGR